MSMIISPTSSESATDVSDISRLWPSGTTGNGPLIGGSLTSDGTATGTVFGFTHNTGSGPVEIIDLDGDGNLTIPGIVNAGVAFQAGIFIRPGLDFRVDGSGLTLATGTFLKWRNGTSVYSDDANHIVQRNGLESQQFSVANTWTDEDDHEILSSWWDSNVAVIGTDVGDTGGTHRDMRLLPSNWHSGDTEGGRIWFGDFVYAYGQAGVLVFATAGANGFRFTNHIEVDSGRDLKVGRGIAMHGSTPPTTQAAAIPDATDAATTQSAVNSLLAAARSIGLIAT